MATVQTVLLTPPTLGPNGGDRYQLSGFDNVGVPADLLTTATTVQGREFNGAVDLGAAFRITSRPTFMGAYRLTAIGLQGWLTGEIKRQLKL
jgi:hypothetical protein